MADAETHESVKDQVVELFHDLDTEVEREVAAPHDSSQSDVLVQKHLNGLAISFFVLIAIFLVAAIVGITLYTHR
jgi:hypothetical protein